MSSTQNRLLLDLAYCAVFAALTIAAAFFTVPIPGLVPIVLQNGVIFLAALILGARRAGLTVGLFFLIALALPVLSGGRTLISALAGPTSGYLVGYLIGAIIAGFIAYRAPVKKPGVMAVIFAIAAVVFGLICYVFGALGLMINGMGLTESIVAQAPFLVPDTAKFVVAVLIALGVHAAFPDLLRGERTVTQADAQAALRKADERDNRVD